MQHIAHRKIDEPAGSPTIELTIRHVDASFKVLFRGSCRNGDIAAKRIPTVERSLRAALHFNSRDIDKRFVRLRGATAVHV
ncbi:MAG: hypothetical protein ACK55I_11120, partial [bacterium]